MWNLNKMGLGKKQERPSEEYTALTGLEGNAEVDKVTPENAASLAMRFVIEYHKQNNDPLGKGPELYKELLALYIESKGLEAEPDFKAAKEWYLEMASVVTAAPNDITKEAEAVKKYILSTLTPKS